MQFKFSNLQISSRVFHADYSQSWKVFYTDTHHHATKMTFVWSGENIRKPVWKGENIFPNGFIHEKVSLNFKSDCNSGKVMPWTLPQLSYSTTPTVFYVFASLFECCSLKNVLLAIYSTTNEFFLWEWCWTQSKIDII